MCVTAFEYEPYEWIGKTVRLSDYDIKYFAAVYARELSTNEELSIDTKSTTEYVVDQIHDSREIILAQVPRNYKYRMICLCVTVHPKRQVHRRERKTVFIVTPNDYKEYIFINRNKLESCKIPERKNGTFMLF
ncbi:unnamed protein product [Bursaphelenchus okinawaensis]|uniref:Uncharacterized protein n=1 Tax=Bursaphelenchus okinawaensis TaxID=465554 RepID=A0A811LMF8_9BILA|nr:unnamed protein product [Bursaphelenchus okinawaensis]CAG9125114.1 unnamed protein product [Bursaphelenchus okinawaensis]